MKSLIGLLMLLAVLCILNACDSWTVEYAIPKEDKCEYDVGDTLIYKCSDGKNSTFLVNEVYVRRLEILGNTEEHQTIKIHNISDTLWYKYIRRQWPLPPPTPNYKIYVCGWPLHPEKGPQVCVKNGVHITGIIGNGYEIAYDSIIFNNKQYLKVYFVNDTPLPSEVFSYDLFWNLKFGIIRFVGYSSSDTICWDLEGKI